MFVSFSHIISQQRVHAPCLSACLPVVHWIIVVVVL